LRSNEKKRRSAPALSAMPRYLRSSPE
jgi:hypothetical protein